MKTKLVAFKTPTADDPKLFHLRHFVTPLNSVQADGLAEHLRLATLEWFKSNGKVENLEAKGVITTLQQELERKH